MSSRRMVCLPSVAVLRLHGTAVATAVLYRASENLFTERPGVLRDSETNRYISDLQSPASDSDRAPITDTSSVSTNVMKSLRQRPEALAARPPPGRHKNPSARARGTGKVLEFEAVAPWQKPKARSNPASRLRSASPGPTWSGRRWATRSPTRCRTRARRPFLALTLAAPGPCRNSDGHGPGTVTVTVRWL